MKTVWEILRPVAIAWLYNVDYDIQLARLICGHRESANRKQAFHKTEKAAFQFVEVGICWKQERKVSVFQAPFSAVQFWSGLIINSDRFNSCGNCGLVPTESKSE